MRRDFKSPNECDSPLGGALAQYKTVLIIKRPSSMNTRTTFLRDVNNLLAA